MPSRLATNMTRKSSGSRRGPCKRPNANFKLSRDLTPLVINYVNDLPNGVATRYLKEQFLSKFVSNETAPEEVRQTAAVEKWLVSEKLNELTCDRILSVDPQYNILPRLTYDRFITTVRRVIVSVIGHEPPEALLGGFSGGSTTSRLRTESHPARKYVGEAHVTAQALQHAEAALYNAPPWGSAYQRDDLTVSVVESNVMFTVPKNTEIDRPCCKEPDLNMYLQKDVGNNIRLGLKKVGIDLNDQSKNRTLARKGSVDSSLATIDLSSASDSVTWMLVLETLPGRWYELMNQLRCSSTILLDGAVHENWMFSSMGNGFTFELESLLFYALAKATCYHEGTKGTISVYGDDIIVPSSVAPLLISVLRFFGFRTNEGKTFYAGPFRESCGGHYYFGIDITPFYIRRPILTLVDLIQVANAIRKWAARNGPLVLDSLMEPLWRQLADHVPRCFWGGNDYESTGSLVSEFYPDNRKRLVPVKGPLLRPVRGSTEDLTDLGMYLLWLDTSESRCDTETYRYVLLSSGHLVLPHGSLEEPIVTSGARRPPSDGMYESIRVENHWFNRSDRLPFFLEEVRPDSP